ncbi:MAG: cardiolipin synthase [Lysobacterales bacterium]|jgi:cardiolipin synthase
MIDKSIKSYGLIGLCLLLSSGCASTSHHKQKDLQRYARSVLNQSQQIELQEAHKGKNILLIKYSAYIEETNDNQEFYGRVQWQSDKELKDNLAKSIAIPFEYISKDRWELAVGELTFVKPLLSKHWSKFLKELLATITPKETNQGVTLRNGNDEYLFFYNEQGELKRVYLKDKPAEVKIVKWLTQEDLNEHTVSSFKAYLKKENINDQRVILSSFWDEAAMSFLYVDLNDNFALSIKAPLDRDNVYKNSAVRRNLKSMNHLVVESHVLGMATRPVSSAFRLFAWAKGTTVGALQNQIQVPNIFIDTTIQPLYEGEGMDVEAFENRLDKIINNKRSHGSMKFLIGGDQFFPRFIEALLDARESIYLRTFIFDNDDYAVKIADILKKKANEGVKIYVLLDGMGQLMGEGKISDTLPAGFTPPKSIAKYLRKNSNIKVRVRPNAWFKADHTKFTIIDRKVVFTGGMNVGREYRYDWHDLMVEIKGPISDVLLEEFDTAWRHSGKLGDLAFFSKIISNIEKDFHKDSDLPLIRPLYTRVNDPQILRAQLEAIKMAKRYIYISNAYFSENLIIEEIIKARRRGVDVRVILPVHGNHEIMNMNNIVVANELFENGIEVYFYPGMSHIKAAIYDGWLCTGSANFDKLSFRDNLEFNISTSHSETVERFKNELFVKDFNKSFIMTKKNKSTIKDHIAKFLAGQL